MKIAVTVGVYNEEKYLEGLLKALLRQNKMPDEIIIVDDGSKDKTADIINEYAAKYPFIKYIYQKNAGPAVARNKAWKNADADICIFTDGDCVPKKNWIEEMIKPFSDEKVGATAGTYATVNKENSLAKFIGYEIAWRYRNIKGEINAHGTYNLAVRKSVLEEVGGLNEEYPKPSGEDWDMTYKISSKYKIIFVRTAIVGHYHPENVWGYMKNQERRAYDRMKLYKDHPDKKTGDTYTSLTDAYRILASGALIFSLIFLYPIFPWSYLIPLFLLVSLLYISVLPFFYYARRSLFIALYSIPIQLMRNFAWFVGVVHGVIKFGI